EGRRRAHAAHGGGERRARAAAPTALTARGVYLDDRRAQTRRTRVRGYHACPDTGAGGPSVTGSRRPQTIAYPAPKSRPRRRDLGPLAPHVIVLFGATGDLAKRKLLPGLGYLAESALAPDIRVVGTAMEDLSTEEFRELTKAAVANFGTHKLD